MHLKDCTHFLLIKVSLFYKFFHIPKKLNSVCFHKWTFYCRLMYDFTFPNPDWRFKRTEKVQISRFKSRNRACHIDYEVDILRTSPEWLKSLSYLQTKLRIRSIKIALKAMYISNELFKKKQEFLPKKSEIFDWISKRFQKHRGNKVRLLIYGGKGKHFKIILKKIFSLYQQIWLLT